MRLSDKYLEYQEKYEKKYGKEKTIVLMQVGSFHEAYSTLTRGYNLHKLSEIVDLVCTRKDKSKKYIDESNPHMLGFPSIALNKYINILIKNGFTLVIIDQVTPPPKPKREVTRIISAGTNIDGILNYENNYIVSLYIEDEIQASGKLLTVVGMTAIDITTGKSIVCERISLKDDDKYALDEASRFMICHNPREILIYRKISSKSMQKIKLISYLELDNKPYKYFEEIPKHYKKISYQTDFLRKIYPDHGMLSPMEYLNIEATSYSRISFIIAVDYAYQHSEKIVKKLEIPILFGDKKHMTLGNDAIYQLGILDDRSLNRCNINGSVRCVNDIVNKASTAMGKRFIKTSLLTPLVSHKEIKSRHKLITAMLNKDKYLKFDAYLKQLPDLERIHRKLILNKLHPMHFVKMIHSYKEVSQMLKLASKSKILKTVIPELKNSSLQKEIDDMIELTNKRCDLKEMEMHVINNITSTFFNSGVYNDIDKLQNKIDGMNTFMDNLESVMSNYIEESPSRYNKHNKLKLSLKETGVEGHFLLLSKKRADILKKKIKNLKSIKITNKYTIDPNTFIYKNLKNQVKISFDKLNRMSREINVFKEELMKEAKQKYIIFMEDVVNKYKHLFNKIIDFISIIDFAKSGAKTAKQYNYTKPTLVKAKQSFIKCKELRHPLVEVINQDVEFIPNDITIGKIDDNKINGMLIFGINSGGKTTIMKALGISIVLAQAGMFVPATEYYFCPYKSLLTRITGNDNILKGLSSFALEMTELKAILRRAGSKTLIIGDEICRGTEHIGGKALVAATIIELSETESNFIFASHLHELVDLEEIKELENVKAYHINVEHDEENDTLVFDRKLREGVGKRIYGITVAKHIINDDKFIKRAQRIKHKLLNTANQVLVNKQSKYNSNVYVDACQICNKKYNPNGKYTNDLDVHHINFQKDCINGFSKVKPYLSKNSKANLIVLCKECHHNVHDGQIFIGGYLETSSGRKVNYKCL